MSRPYSGKSDVADTLDQGHFLPSNCCSTVMPTLYNEMWRWEKFIIRLATFSQWSCLNLKMPWPTPPTSNVVEVVFCRTKCDKMAVIHQNYYFHHNRKYKVMLQLCLCCFACLIEFIYFFFNNREVITGAVLNEDAKSVSSAAALSIKNPVGCSFRVATVLSNMGMSRTHPIWLRKNSVASWSPSSIELQPISRDRLNRLLPFPFV